MKFSSHQTLRKQQGAILFIMIMILVALTVITMMATNMGKTDLRISNAYAEQSKAFIKGEEMLERLRYALEQVPLPEGIALIGAANKTDRPIWLTKNLAASTNSKDGEPDFTSPTFVDNGTYEGWSDKNKVLTCTDIATWMQKYAGLANANRGGRFEPLDCKSLDPENKTRTVIELINRKQNDGDIDELRNTYYYRITIYANYSKDDDTGRSLVQGVTGIQYN